MDAGTPNGARRRGFRRWRTVLVLLAASPLLLLVALNLVLCTPWARGWIAKKIGQRAGGLEATVARASWTPWGGITVGGIELLQPPPLRAAVKQPLVSVESVKADPVWRAWLRGRQEISGLVIDTPRVVLPLELVSHLAANAAPVAQPSQPPPAVAATTPAAPSTGEAPVPTPETAPPATAPPQIVQPPVAPPAPTPPPQPVLPTAFVDVRNASLSVVLASRELTLTEISGISGIIPVAGGNARSGLEIGGVKIAGQQVLSKTKAELDWTGPFLSLQPVQFEIGGHPVAIAGKIAMAGGLPLQIEARAPRHALEEISLPFGARASAASVAVEARFRGLLLAPASWQGDLLAESIAPVIRTEGRETRFDRASTVTVLRGGILSCADARLVGDHVSLLGNATLLADGRCAGALRLVSAPETVSYAAGKVFPMLSSGPPLTPLSTPQRVAFDLEAAGNIGQLFLRLGRGGPVIEFKP